MLKAYKYKIKPNKQQEELLSKFFGCTRFIYNWGLNKKTSAYKENGKSINYLQLAKELTLLKKTDEALITHSQLSFARKQNTQDLNQKNTQGNPQSSFHPFTLISLIGLLNCQS